jgi:HlyD family secretion protein
MTTTSRFCVQILLMLLVLSGCSSSDEYPVVGTLERDRIALAAEMTEPVTQIHVREGQLVEAGTVLVELDRRRAEADLARLEAIADRAHHRLQELLRGPRQESIEQARAHLAASESAWNTARDEFQRIERLQQRNLASESQLGSAHSVRDQARGEYDAARATLAALVEGTTVEELDQAHAAVREAAAAVERQQLTTERLTLTAPRAARIEALPFELGETPRVGQFLVVLRATDQPPYARVYIPAELHRQFQPGQRVQVRVDGHGDKAGRVRFIASEAAYTPYFALTEHDAGRLNYLAEIDLEDADGLPSGIPVRAVIPRQVAAIGHE